MAEFCVNVSQELFSKAKLVLWNSLGNRQDLLFPTKALIHRSKAELVHIDMFVLLFTKICETVKLQQASGKKQTDWFSCLAATHLSKYFLFKMKIRIIKWNQSFSWTDLILNRNSVH